MNFTRAVRLAFVKRTVVYKATDYKIKIATCTVAELNECINRLLYKIDKNSSQFDIDMYVSVKKSLFAAIEEQQQEIDYWTSQLDSLKNK